MCGYVGGGGFGGVVVYFVLPGVGAALGSVVAV